MASNNNDDDNNNNNNNKNNNRATAMMISSSSASSSGHHQTQYMFEFDQQVLHHQLQDHHHQHQHHQHPSAHHLHLQHHFISFGGMMPSSSSSTLPHPLQALPPAPSSCSYIVGKEPASSSSGGGSGAYDLGELDHALFLYLDGQATAATAATSGALLHPPPLPPAAAAVGADNTSSSSSHRHHNRNESSSITRPPMLYIFPSQPMHIDPSIKGINNSTDVIMDPAMAAQSASTSTTAGGNGSERPPSEVVVAAAPPMELSTKPKTERGATISIARPAEHPKTVKREGNLKGPASRSERETPKTPDPKTLRRLAQNREAARKSRLRKKAYVQQLESSRIKLTQLEQELQRARAQGIFFGRSGALGGDQGLISMGGVTSISSDAAVFDLEYARWLEEHHRLTCELRAAVQEHVPEAELKLYVDNCLAHCDAVINLKSMVAKSDVFHIFSGMWKTPAERCFMWIGGFRPSEIIKIILHHMEPLTEQQLLGICQLQQSTQEAEEALSQGLEALNQSLSDTIVSDSLSCPPNMANYMGQMALAMNKLSSLESFVRQADSLRHQTFHRLNQLLTIRQAARCFLAVAEYFHRLRVLSSLWLARPRQE